MLAGEHWLIVTLRDQIEFRFKQRRGRLKSGIRGRCSERKLLALDIGRRLDGAVGWHNDLHLVAESAVLAGHDGERHEARTIYRNRIGAGIEARNVKAAGAHRLNFSRVRLHRKEYDLFAGDLLHM